MRGSGSGETRVQCSGFVLRDDGLGFCSAVVGGGGGWLTGCWDFWWVVVAGLMGLWDFCCCCWILYRSMDFIVAGLFTVLWILYLLIIWLFWICFQINIVGVVVLQI